MGILTGRGPFSRPSTPAEADARPAAFFNGAVFTVIGLSIMAGTGLLWLRGEADLMALLGQRPGLVLAPLGAVLFGAGGSRLVDAPLVGDSLGHVLQSLPYRLVGLILVLAGLLALAVGLYEMLDPGGFDQLVASLLGPLTLLPP